MVAEPIPNALQTPGVAWKQEHTRWPFKLGPFPLGSARLSLAVAGNVLSHPLRSVAELEALAWPDTAGLDGLLLYGHPVAGPLPTRFDLGPWLGYTAAVAEHHVADLSLGPDAYWASLSGNTRSQLKRKQKAFEAASGGELDWRVYHTPDEVQTFHRLALPLSQRTYQHKLFNAGLPDDPAFVAQMQALAAQGQVWAFLLWFQGDPVAYLYLEGLSDRLLYAYVGHDDAHSRLSPGAVLMAQALLHMQRQGGYRWFDFGSGEGQHKSTFATGRLQLAQVYLLRRSVRLWLLVATHRALGAVSRVMTEGLRRSGLHAWLKARVRRAVRES